MSKYWNSGDELADAVIGMYDRMKQDQEVVSKTSKLNTLVVYKYNDPDTEVWWDTRDGRFEYGKGEPPAKFDVRMTLSGDDAHKAWSNKLNTVMAITRRRLKVEGAITQMLKLSPLLSKFALAYNENLKQMGKESIIL